MDHAILARALHILGVVLWIGGVGFVTTVLLPAVRRMKAAEERVTFFQAVEQRFAWQARVTTLLVGGSGLYLVHAGARARPEQTFRRIERMHWLLLFISLVTVLGAMAGSHGWVS